MLLGLENVNLFSPLLSIHSKYEQYLPVGPFHRCRVFKSFGKHMFCFIPSPSTWIVINPFQILYPCYMLCESMFIIIQISLFNRGDSIIPHPWMGWPWRKRLCSTYRLRQLDHIMSGQDTMPAGWGCLALSDAPWLSSIWAKLQTAKQNFRALITTYKLVEILQCKQGVSSIQSRVRLWDSEIYRYLVLKGVYVASAAELFIPRSFLRPKPS